MVPAWTGAPESPEVLPGCTRGVSGPTGSTRGATARLVPGRFTAPRYSDFEPDSNNLWAVKLSPLPGSTRGKQLLAALEVRRSCVFLPGILGDMSSDLQWLLQGHQAAEGPSTGGGGGGGTYGPRCAAWKCWDLWQPLTQGIFSQDKSSLTQYRMGSTKPAVPWCSTHGWTPSAWKWAVNCPRFLRSAARGQRCPETGAEPSATRGTSGSCLRISLQPHQESASGAGSERWDGSSRGISPEGCSAPWAERVPCSVLH